MSLIVLCRTACGSAVLDEEGAGPFLRKLSLILHRQNHVHHLWIIPADRFTIPLQSPFILSGRIKTVTLTAGHNISHHTKEELGNQTAAVGNAVLVVGIVLVCDRFDSRMLRGFVSSANAFGYSLSHEFL